jgi:hypothetical protein
LLVALITLALLAAVVFVISGPLRASRVSPGGDPAPPAGAVPEGDVERDELQSAREAKYREIRDAELDFRTGKLSREDYQAVDAELRAEAVAILDRIEALDRGRGGA